MLHVLAEGKSFDGMNTEAMNTGQLDPNSLRTPNPTAMGAALRSTPDDHDRKNKDLLLQLDAADLCALLALPPDDRIGGIIRLNGAPRYHNRLNVVELLVRLAELRQETRTARRRHPGRK